MKTSLALAKLHNIQGEMSCLNCTPSIETIKSLSDAIDEMAKIMASEITKHATSLQE